MVRCVGNLGKLSDLPSNAPPALCDFFQQALVLGQWQISNFKGPFWHEKITPGRVQGVQTLPLGY